MTGPATTFIVDGIWGRPRRFVRLQQVLAESGAPSVIFEYDASGQKPFEELGAQLAEAIRQHGGPVNTVGFSMGGLVVRAAKLVDPSLPIRRAAFLNSPHQGSWLAYLLPWPGVRQIRPGSDFLRQLDAALWPIPTLTVWCPGDLMVLSGWRAKWSLATESICSLMPAHIWPIYSRKLHQKVAKFLTAS